MSKYFGDRLRQLRLARGLRVREVAEVLGLTPVRLSRIERGLADTVDDDFIQRVAAYFDETSTDELLLMAGRLPADLRGILQQHPAEGALLLREHFGTPRTPDDVATRSTTLPPALTTALAEWTVRADGDTVLDPSCGDGTLLAAAAARLLALGATPSAVADQLHGYDSDGEACARTLRRLRGVIGVSSHLIRRQSFLRAESRSRLPFQRGGTPAVTAIVGVMRSDGRAAGSVHRRHARAVAAEAGIELPDTAAPWAALLVHAASCVRAGGRLALLVPPAILHAHYAGTVRAYLAQLFSALIVVTFERPVPGVGETILLLGDGAGPAGVRSLRVRDASELTATRLADAATAGVAEAALRWSGASLPTPGHALLQTLQRRSVLRRLGELAHVNPGVVTGANHFFVLDAATAERIDKAFLRPAIATTRDATGLTFRERDWEDLRDTGQGCFLLAIPSDAAVGKATKAYLAQGERDGVPERATCRRRPVWYCLPALDQPAAFLTYLCRRWPRMLLNEAGVTHANALHSVQPRVGMNMAALVASFPSTATLLGCELLGRRYGAGVLQLEPAEAANLLVAYPTDDCERVGGLLPHLDALWRSGREVDAIALIDEEVLVRTFKVDAAVVADLQHCYTAERERRRALARYSERESR